MVAVSCLSTTTSFIVWLTACACTREGDRSSPFSMTRSITTQNHVTQWGELILFIFQLVNFEMNFPVFFFCFVWSFSFSLLHFYEQFSRDFIADLGGKCR